MALINCNECNAQISDKAKTCPKCGIPVTIKEKFKCFECNSELEKGTKICSNCGAEQEVKQDVKKEIKEELKKAETNITTVPPVVQKKKSKWLMWTLMSVGALALIVVTAIVIRNQNNSTINAGSQPMSSPQSSPPPPPPPPPVEKTPEELRQELKDKEIQNPASYLTVKYTLDVKVHLLKESEDIVNGTIFNSAKMATFKDIGIKVNFLSETGTLLDTKQYTLYKFVTPNGSQDFQITVLSPSGTSKIGVEVVSASSE